MICSTKVDICEEEVCPNCKSGEINQIIKPYSHKTDNICRKCGHKWIS